MSDGLLLCAMLLQFKPLKILCSQSRVLYEHTVLCSFCYFTLDVSVFVFFFGISFQSESDDLMTVDVLFGGCQSNQIT